MRPQCRPVLNFLGIPASQLGCFSNFNTFYKTLCALQLHSDGSESSTVLLAILLESYKEIETRLEKSISTAN